MHPKGGIAMKRGVGILLLGIWLLLHGLITLIGIHFPYSGVIMGLLALISGILLLVGR
jgi:hypothetical protein